MNLLLRPANFSPVLIERRPPRVVEADGTLLVDDDEILVVIVAIAD